MNYRLCGTGAWLFAMIHYHLHQLLTMHNGLDVMLTAHPPITGVLAATLAFSARPSICWFDYTEIFLLDRFDQLLLGPTSILTRLYIAATVEWLTLCLVAQLPLGWLGCNRTSGDDLLVGWLRSNGISA